MIIDIFKDHIVNNQGEVVNGILQSDINGNRKKERRERGSNTNDKDLSDRLHL